MFQPYEALQPYVDVAAIINAQGTAAKAMTQNNARVVRVDSLYLSSDDTVAVNIELQLYNGTVSGLLGSVAVPAGSGNAGVPAVEALSALLVAGQQFLVVPVGGYVAIRAETAVTAGKTVTATALGEVF